MRDINITFTSADTLLYKDVLIRQGENLASRFIITIPEDMLDYQYILVFKINNETPIFTTEQFPVDGVITYDVTNTLTSISGDLKIELHAYENLSLINEVLIKSALCKLKVAPTLDAASEIVPQDYVPWYTQVASMYDEIVDIEEHVDEVYDDIVTEELVRQEEEAIRVSNENYRKEEEELRAIAEADRHGSYAAQELVRDSQYATAEGERDSAYNAQELVRDGLYNTAEGVRDADYSAAEALRRSAETARAVFEAYDAETAYVVGNKVAYAGCSYTCIQNNTGETPVSGSPYWLLIAEGGAATSYLTGMVEAETYSSIADTDTINTAFGKVKKFFSILDAKFYMVDTVTGVPYIWYLTISDGVPIIKLVEQSTPNS